MSSFKLPDFNHLTPIFHDIDEMTQSLKSSYTQNIQSRYTTFIFGGGQEILALAQNSFKALGQLLGLGVKLVTTPLENFEKLSSLKEFNAKLPTVSTLWETAKRIVAVAVGLLCTLTLGVIHPTTNYRVQTALGLVVPKVGMNTHLGVLMSDEELEALTLGI